MTDLDRDGVRIHYAVHGVPTRRPPLLLTHGYAASSAMWEPNVAALSEDWQVITWDLRGHGRSGSVRDPARCTEQTCVADMAGILDACDAERAVVGGLSLGGYLSLAFYLAAPERVQALALFDTGPGFKDDAARRRWNATADGIASQLEQQGLSALSDSETLSPGPGYRGTSADPAGLAAAARGVLAQRDARVINSLPSISVPCLVLVGADDAGYLAATDYMAAKVPGASKAVIPGAGHAANIDQPALFNRTLLAFLGGLG